MGGSSEWLDKCTAPCGREASPRHQAGPETEAGGGGGSSGGPAGRKGWRGARNLTAVRSPSDTPTHTFSLKRAHQARNWKTLRRTQLSGNLGLHAEYVAFLKDTYGHQGMTQELHATLKSMMQIVRKVASCRIFTK